LTSEKDCKILVSGALSFEGVVPIALAHQIIGLAISGNAPPSSGAFSPTMQNIPAGASAKAFVAAKRPTTDVEKVACIAFFLTHSENTPRFKAPDIERVMRDAALDISNLTRAIDNSTRQSKFLAKAGEGAKQITAFGEAVVNALPNREAVTAALKEIPVRRRKRSAKKKKHN